MIKNLKRFAPILVLVIQNLIVFRGHYFEDVGFPWDFPMAYYALVAFWTSAAANGIDPQWIPFQQMGYPFALQLQSGFNYPPFWIFPVLQIPYTLNVAVVVQCLHILFGTLGMFFLVRGIVGSNQLALVGAFVFQFFGGFYSNAEHPDIIRAFAFAPWLLHVFNLNIPNSPACPRRVFWIPLFFFLLITGAYPGNIFSSIFILAIYVLLQLIAGFANQTSVRDLIRTGAIVLGLTLLGAAMATIQLAPVLLYRDQVVRTENFQALPRFTLWIEHLPGFFLSNRTLPGEISMTLTYVTLPALVFASLIPFKKLGQVWLYLSIGAISLLMATGDRLPVWTTLSELFLFLKISRMTSSDYRVFIAIALVILAVLGLEAVLLKKLHLPDILFRLILIGLWFFPGLTSVYYLPDGALIGAMLIASATLGLVLVLWHLRPGLTVYAVASVLVLITVDALRVLPDLPTWQEPRISNYYASRSLPYARAGKLVVSEIFDRLPARRPPRNLSERESSWAGYLDGRYLMDDLPPNLLKPYFVVNTHQMYRDYMRQEWSPRFIDPGAITDNGTKMALTESDLVFFLNDARTDANASVKQIYYGINEIVYQVELNQARWVLENELYFPGWRARLILPDREIALTPLAINGIFRAWHLPAGAYKMKATFQFPYLELFRVISLVACIGWGLILLIALRAKRGSTQADSPKG